MKLVLSLSFLVLATTVFGQEREVLGKRLVCRAKECRHFIVPVKKHTFEQLSTELDSFRYLSMRGRSSEFLRLKKLAPELFSLDVQKVMNVGLFGKGPRPNAQDGGNCTGGIEYITEVRVCEDGSKGVVEKVCTTTVMGDAGNHCIKKTDCVETYRRDCPKEETKEPEFI